MPGLLVQPESLHGFCPIPFFQETRFSNQSGFVAGRLCQPFPTLQGNVSCCLPCPATDWIYSDGFVPRTEAANWLNLAALIASIFLLLSFVVLPVKWTHRHYLSICLSVGVVFIELAFVIPQAARPDQCHNEITPNDMHTSLTCAFSGAFLLFGGWAAMMWVLYRALFLHLQICWQIVPGVKFFWSALVIGWGIPAAGLTLALSLTGVSFRFGNVCHINHSDSLGDFWGPLLFVAACSLVIQAITFGYCIKVYLKSVMDPKTTTDNSSALPSYQGSTQSISPRQKYRRIQKVLYMQWRGVAVVMLIIFNVVFFSVVFVSMDNNLQATNAHVAQIEPWLACLSLTQGNKVQCLPLAKDLVTNEATIIAVLVFISLSGFWCLLFLGRWSMVLGWIDLCKRRMGKTNEFVSADARRLSNDPRTYEMLRTTPQPPIKNPDVALISPHSNTTDEFSPQTGKNGDYFGRDAKYRNAPNSFSAPRTVSTLQGGRDWDPRSTYAPGQDYQDISVFKG